MIDAIVITAYIVLVLSTKLFVICFVVFVVLGVLARVFRKQLDDLAYWLWRDV